MQEGAGQTFPKPRARIEGQSAGALADGASQRQGSIAAAPPQFFLHPLAEAFHVLVAGPPSIVAALDEVQHPAGVGAGGVIVDRPPVAFIVERQLLGVAQSVAEDLQRSAVGFTPQDPAAVRKVDATPLPVRQARTTVAETEVDAPIGTLDESMQVMS